MKSCFASTRRSFLVGGATAALLTGCRGSSFLSRSKLRLGVLSDIHIRDAASVEPVERAFRFYRSRGVDAVLIAGDLTDWGTKGSLVLLREAWDRNFAGTGVKPLFVTGNHDFEGWWYGDMTMEMHALGVSEDEALVKLGLPQVWEEVLGEKWEPVRVRTVNGYDFLSSEWLRDDQLLEWMKANGARYHGDKPFFVFRHAPLKGTVCPDDPCPWGNELKALLEEYPNCIFLTGHIHRPFNEETCIWQGGFTAISIPSLSYASAPSGHENGQDHHNGSSIKAMPIIPTRMDLRGGQGYLLEVFEDEIVIERRDFDENTDGAKDWVLPLPLCREKPYSPEFRRRQIPAPEFPRDAQLKLATINTDNRQGKWTVGLECRFPSATIADGSRIYDYEILAVAEDGSETLVKRFISPAFARLAKYEPAEQRFWFDVAELPQAKPYHIEVRARTCYGVASKPIVSEVRCGKPGLGDAKDKDYWIKHR